MKISAKCDYACRALLELTLQNETKKPVRVSWIAERQDVPLKYLVQILNQLKRAGLVVSERGRSGGYYLGRSPDKITLGEVIRSIEGPLLSINCLDGNSRTRCSIKSSCTLKQAWDELKVAMENVADSITFKDICDNLKSTQRVIYHI